MNDQTENYTDQSAAFQKIWLESMSKLMQTAFTFTPNSAPPELLRQMRTGILQALSESWNEFLRSPKFQEGMKQWMDSAVGFRKMSNDFMGKVRKEMQAPTRDDIDAVMLAVRHMETRVLDRLEEVEKQVNALHHLPRKTQTQKTNVSAATRTPKSPGQRGRANKKAGKL
jgi:hypothetical protein